MKRIEVFCCLCLLSASFLHAEKVDKEGKNWLEENAEPAGVNVNGVWFSDGWGSMTLEQPQESRKIVGDCDEWKIDGIVSGKKVFLLFSYTGDIEYSAVLVAEQENSLKGVYSSGLMKDRPGNKKMMLEKKSSTVVQPAVGGEDQTARVIVYRFLDEGYDPPIYLDGRQLVWLPGGYFSFRVSAGTHAISRENRNQPVTIDARAGQTYCIQVGRLTFDDKLSKKIQLVSREEGRTRIKNLKPLAAKFVLTDSIVLLDPISMP